MNKLLYNSKICTKTKLETVEHKDLLSLTLNGVIKRDMENPKGKFPASFDKYKIVNKGDLIFCLFDIEETPRTIGISEYDGMITGAYDVLKCEGNLSNRFVYYYFLNKDNYKSLKPYYKSLRNKINISEILRLDITNYTILEQKKIANFLDEKIKKIDEKILNLKNKNQKSNQFFQKIKNEKYSVNNNLTKVKYIAEINPKALKNNDIKKATFIPMEKLRKSKVEVDLQIDSEIADGKYTYFEENDILLAKVTPCFENQNIAIAKNLINKKGYGSSEIIVIRASKQILKDYLLYYLQTTDFIENGKSTMTGSAGLKRVSTEYILNCSIPLVDLNLQKEIIKEIKENEELENKYNGINNKKILLLEEYKKVLINDAVTGKIDIGDEYGK